MFIKNDEMYLDYQLEHNQLAENLLQDAAWLFSAEQDRYDLLGRLLSEYYDDRRSPRTWQTITITSQNE